MSVQTHDGGSMPVVVTWPSSGRGPGLVVVQEIFGVTEYIKRRAQDLADLGYVALIPELYWRLGNDLVTDETSEAGLQEAFGLFSKLDVPYAVDDTVAALEHLRSMPETGGRAGILGFCLGGRVAYEVGVKSNPDVVVSYYGSGTVDRVDAASDVTCPVLFHFGGADPYIPAEHTERIQAAFAAHPAAAEFHAHAGAGHAFDNFRAPIFYHQAASEASWPQTVAFLQREFPPRRT